MPRTIRKVIVGSRRRLSAPWRIALDVCLESPWFILTPLMVCCFIAALPALVD
jgi:hypothetical protein